VPQPLRFQVVKTRVPLGPLGCSGFRPRPRLVAGRSGEVPWGVSLTFLVIVVSYPWVIPWGQIFGG
jgi:hypothetical protein